MKHLKILGLAAIAAMGLMALVGVSAAQAALFTDSVKTVKYSTGTVVDLSLKSGSATKLTNGSETVTTCTESTAKGKTSEAGETVFVNIETLTWGGCSKEFSKVYTGKLEITWSSGSNGEVIGQEMGWELTISGASCKYGLGEGVKLGTLKGGETPTLDIEALVPRTTGGFLCPSALTWDAEYVVTEPHALYVGSAPLMALFTDSSKTVRYPAETVFDFSLKSGTTTKITSGGSTLATCTESTAKGKTSSETGESISINLETLTWGGCSQTIDTVAKGKLEIKWTSGSSGEVIGKESQWTISTFGTSCSYGFGEGVKLGTITGGEAPVLKIEATVTKTAGGFVCPATTGFDGEYIVTEPHAVYPGPVTLTSLFTDSGKTVRYPTGVVVDLTLESGSTAKFTANGGETIVTCTGSTAKGKTATGSGEANLVNLETLTWSGCGATADAVINGKLEITATSGGNGEVIGKESQWTLGVFGTSCSYGFGEGIKLGALIGGETPTLKIEAVVPRTAGGILCPGAVTWDANYVVTEPHALYMS